MELIDFKVENLRLEAGAALSSFRTSQLNVSSDPTAIDRSRKSTSSPEPSLATTPQAPVTQPTPGSAVRKIGVAHSVIAAVPS
jgi:hypothetical protein